MELKKTDDAIFIDEVIYSVKARDLIKTKILLRESPTVSVQSTRRLLLEIIKSNDSFAIPLLIHIMTYLPEISSKTPSIISALQQKIINCEDLSGIATILSDVNEKSYFLESLSEKDDEATKSFLISLVRSETDVRVIKSILKVMAEIKNSKFASFIADFLYSEDKSLVSQAIETLGLCANDQAIDTLINRAGADTKLDGLIIKQLKKIGSEKSIKALITFLYSGVSSLRNGARQALAELKESSVPSLAEALKDENSNIVILTLNILGETGVLDAVKPVRKFIQTMPENANVRFAAYEALGLLPAKTGAYTLTQGLLDEDEGVRIAAARAVNQQFDHLFERGVMNLFELEESKALIVDALLTAECNKVVSAMIHNPEFNECAIKILKERRDKDLLDFYMSLAKNINLSCDISIRKSENSKSVAQGICVVDDSRLLLKIYRKILTELNIEFHLFEFAEAALEFIKEDKPSLILTDLNMPVMDGIEFTKCVRDVYDASDLPIVMVTTQNEESDRSAALESGVQDYLNKPFDKESLERVIQKYLK